ncbi:MAG: class I SAM-dependent methyltransferase [Lewinellaceae bacterium]|nr:class I SAM-dependent methyltransferase [Phaeodactylibacter sp.]MCB9035187.1 class I SAM-dependent methyltransferase [Lewinellaceae bacterium]
MQHKPYTTFAFFKWAIALCALAAIGLATAEGAFGLPVFLPGMALLILAFAILIFRIVQLIFKFELSRFHDTNQVESLLWLYSRFTPSVSLPAMRHFAGSPDFLKALADCFYRYQPKVIVEAGSGVSSIILSELLLSTKSTARHYALDHLEKYASQTREKIANPGSKVLYAPLREYLIDGKSWKWYDLSALDGVEQIDMLVIDGPPEPIQKLARYPALPLLKDKLSPNAIIILDDTNRRSEQRIIQLWKEEFDLESQSIYTEKGTVVMGRKGFGIFDF